MDQASDHQWSLRNMQVELTLALNGQGQPYIARLIGAGGSDWVTKDKQPFGPVVIVDEQVFQPGASTMAFTGAEAQSGKTGLCLKYLCQNGLEVHHHLRLSADRPVWRCWTTLINTTDHTCQAITRFDALNISLGTSGAEPQVAYLLGWLFGPRMDAPGRPPSPYPYPSWIPRLLYGENAVLPQPPAGGWSSSLLRLVKERLVKLPLRSGKRSTFDNHPWVTVLDPEHQAGFFAGFEWSGTWKMDIEYRQETQAVSMIACSDGCAHTLKPGEKLESPAAFMGLFAGDWEGAFNTCRSYVSAEVMPQMPAEYPLTTYCISPLHPEMSRIWRQEVDAAAELGAELFTIDAGWWRQRFQGTDFSYGLGCFEESRAIFSDGLRAVSDTIHSKGMKLGLWFEIERVDLRTSRTGRNPWKPEWLVHQKGHPYRSWCQHVYLLCLGVKEAAEWALENISWAVREYNLDNVLIDSNEWAVCDDPTHDHAQADGEWAQIHGLYHVFSGLHQTFPNLIITNLGGGSQRSDFGMARYSHIACPSDVNYPSTSVRKYSLGMGTIYPTGFTGEALLNSPGENLEHTPPGAPGRITTEHLDWRCLNRMMGAFSIIYTMSQVDKDSFSVIQKAVATQRKIKKALQGDRYVLSSQPVFIERENLEADAWEIYEYVSQDAHLVALFAFRCMSRNPEQSLVLRGLIPGAVYQLQSHSGRWQGAYSSAELMNQGILFRLEQQHSADVLILQCTKG